MKKRVFILVLIVLVFAAFMLAGCDGLFSEDKNDDTDEGGGGGGGGAGSTRNNAISVSVGYSGSHSINTSGQHWFKFVGDGNPVIFETTGNAVATTITVYTGDSSLSSNNSSSGGAGSNALVNRSTTSGTNYFVRITTRSSTYGTYTFVVE